MNRMESCIACAAVLMTTVAVVSGCGGRAAPQPAQVHQTDSAYTEVQARGKVAMGVDQYTSKHIFADLPDGGRIELQREVDDAGGVATIRAHMRTIADAFTRGDFAIPGFVHQGEVPGTRVMSERRNAIAYTVHDLPRGAEVRITTTDPEAIRAVHEFLAFQRADHRAHH